MRYNKERCAIETSVRTLCALGAKSGDLDSRRASENICLAMKEGAEIHKRLQAEAGGYYNPEVPLVNTTLYEGLYYTVSGRADGIIRREDGLTVDEIKTVHTYEFFLPPREAHLAQLRTYAYFLAVRDDLDIVSARLTYYNVDTEKIKYFNYTYTRSELRAFYEDLLSKVHFFALVCADRSLEVLDAAARTVFPYSELREGQEMMIRESYGAIKRGQRLFIEAPTGTGKTISSLFPAIRALGEGKVDKVFYLTAKASTRKEAYSAVHKLFSTGVRIRSVVLNAKESMCQCTAKSGGAFSSELCSPVTCPYACGYYDRVNDALRELLDGANGYPARLILAVAEKYKVCPYELSLDLSEYCDVIICDYNYAFDPLVYLRRYFADDGRRENYAFLIDEAHNLADRARAMYSAETSLARICSVRGAITENEAELDCAFGEVERAFLSLKRLCSDNIVKDAQGFERGFYMSHSPLTSFLESLELFKKKCEAYLKKERTGELHDLVYSLTSEIRRYLCINEYFDKGCLCYVQIFEGDILVKTYCLDPSRIMNSLFGRAQSSVLFSATLTPSEYFQNVLGCAKSGVFVSLPSPFDSQNTCVAVLDSVSTRFEDRDANISKYVSAIAATVSAKAGNYIVYFPSYDCLEKVSRAFAAKYPKVRTIVQKRNMTFKEKEEFLSGFKNDEGVLRVGFCVLGGAFAEGVDLPGSRLIGTVIIGVGLPGLSNERNIIRDYFDEDAGEGYNYAYTYPGMNNVLQAAGRVIRTDADRGMIVLVDDRYATLQYRSLFPSHWKNVYYSSDARSLSEIARRFWQEQ